MNDEKNTENERILNITLEKPKKSKKVDLKKPRKRRQIANHDSWNQYVTNFQDESFQSIIDGLEKGVAQWSMLISHIKTKIRGYYAQDKEKKLVNDEKFVTYDNVIQLFRSSNGICHYCKSDVLFLYEYVRDPKQWTLERKNNDYGHNNDNVVLACLNCNVRRKTMKMERYEMTKLMTTIEKIGHNDEKED